MARCADGSFEIGASSLGSNQGVDQPANQLGPLPVDRVEGNGLHEASSSRKGTRRREGAGPREGVGTHRPVEAGTGAAVGLTLEMCPKANLVVDNYAFEY